MNITGMSRTREIEWIYLTTRRINGNLKRKMQRKQGRKERLRAVREEIWDAPWIIEVRAGKWINDG